MLCLCFTYRTKRSIDCWRYWVRGPLVHFHRRVCCYGYVPRLMRQSFSLDLEEVHAGCLPAEKAKIIEKLKAVCVALASMYMLLMRPYFEYTHTHNV